MINKKRGFKRLANVTTLCLLGFLVCGLVITLIFDPPGARKQEQIVAIVWCMGGALILPQALFYLVNYIIEGFTKAPE